MPSLIRNADGTIVSDGNGVPTDCSHRCSIVGIDMSTWVGYPFIIVSTMPDICSDSSCGTWGWGSPCAWINNNSAEWDLIFDTYDDSGWEPNIYWKVSGTNFKLSGSSEVADLELSSVFILGVKDSYWQLSIALQNDDGYKYIWEGIKYCGASPAGIYDFFSSDCGNGNGGASTLEVYFYFI